MFVLPADTANFQFPPVDLASPEGLLAIGGDLRTERLLAAYRAGVFPWYSAGQPILWWSPDPRAVLLFDKLKVSRSLTKTLRKQRFRVTLDTRFREVIQACSSERSKQETPGTWIHPEMIEAYCELHQQGYAHSVETWLDDTLVGGLYGISLGGGFFGESMFSRASDASKVALVYLVRQLQRWDFDFIDAQITSAHLIRMGAEEVRRSTFMAMLEKGLKKPTHKGAWELDDDLTIIATAESMSP
ncbi:MAG: leucyl/phenylalanyl-tRNA--protein transferase [Acidithiobacillales bacterium SG8_45]|jgi:leucyl/phenylalanyl-tRNA--protein transferase|nr:MAG: leucyl/phenylalanyl-tRNA--protein transferase [Acidithiobacillales bacterium SG8_45]